MRAIGTDREAAPSLLKLRHAFRFDMPATGADAGSVGPMLRDEELKTARGRTGP